jgi:hypothetical protein
VCVCTSSSISYSQLKALAYLDFSFGFEIKAYQEDTFGELLKLSHNAASCSFLSFLFLPLSHSFKLTISVLL